ncbi:hypothetical protein AVEN_36863-1 [Araneus ventricosus]|uniref:Uncharacterized protein n=1 Tax=Araneus ventricosus TaxID=182803 RepID=A0A4Y2R9S3_ARAVE|nr:hypothetical protein AVEN_36863-1 [Araneus ventricosus]
MDPRPNCTESHLVSGLDTFNVLSWVKCPRSSVVEVGMGCRFHLIMGQKYEVPFQQSLSRIASNEYINPMAYEFLQSSNYMTSGGS